ncbi:MAG: electron transport complex subunit E [Lachnospiraceae bacterium]|nr:electron transport complex subunit E [Lachnospiraceae bacterium]
MNRNLSVFKEGIFENNPILIQVVGMCATLATSTSLINGVGMGLSTTAVLVGSNVVIALLRKYIPDTVRIPCFIVVIASFVTIVQLLLQAYIPSLNQSLGLFIPLIVVNCIILARAESFASKNSVIASFWDGLGNGLGFTMVLAVMGIFREFFGSGKFLNMQVLPDAFPRTLMLVMAPGAFFTLGCFMAAFKHVMAKKKAAESKNA